MLYCISYTNIVQIKILITHNDYLTTQSIEDEKERKSAMKLLTKGYEYFTTNSDWYKGIDTGSGIFRHYGGETYFTIKNLNQNDTY